MPAKLIVYFRNEKLGLDLKDGVYRLGRDKPADIVIPDSTLSANHAELQISGDSALLRDLGSTNGTFVNEERIHAARSIGPKDQIRLGAVRVSLSFPEEKKAVVEKPKSAPKMAAVRQAGSRMRWTTKFLIAGLAPIFALLVLFFVIQAYADATEKRTRIAHRFQTIAAQYVHILRDPKVTAVPPPVSDESMQFLLIANRDGHIVYPAPETAPDGSIKETPSPLIHPKTKKVFLGAKFELFDIPKAVLKKDDPPLQSYPIRAGGDLFGYVIASPKGGAGSTLGSITGLLLIATVIGIIVLLLTQRRAAGTVRRRIHDLATRFSPFMNGFVDALPRSADVPELDEIADEFEGGFRAFRASAAGAGPKGTQKLKAFEYAAPLVDLVEDSEVAYCFLDGDFKLLAGSRALSRIGEFSKVTSGMSIFDGGLTAIQSKQLVQTITDARRDQKASTRLALHRDGESNDHVVLVRAMTDPGTGAALFGLVFSYAAT